jgi:hypothetical protein
VLLMLAAVVNRYGIDLQEAVRRKETQQHPQIAPIRVAITLPVEVVRSSADREHLAAAFVGQQGPEYDCVVSAAHPPYCAPAPGGADLTCLLRVWWSRPL